MSNEIGAGIAIAGIALALSYCAVNDRRSEVERLRICAEHGGKATKLSNCELPRKEQP